jgi:hypothetical protein
MVDSVFKLACFAVVNRGNQTAQMQEEIIRKQKLYNARFVVVDIPDVKISSTEIRNRIKKKESIKYLVPDAVEKYIYMMEHNNNACVEEHENSMEDDMEEFMFMGLRKLEGVSEKEFEERFDVPMDEVYEKVINKFTNNKLLIRKNGRLYLSEEGIQLSNQVMCEFIL